MSSQHNENSEFVRIELTDAQQKELQDKTGKPAEAIEFTVEELEERIAPRRAFLE